MNIQTFPVIKTERLTLRKIEESDSDVILFLRSDKSINKFINRPENRRTKNISDAIKHIRKLNADTKNNNSFACGITVNDNPEITGKICLWNFSKDYKTAEVGYDLNPNFQKKGIMSKSLKSVVNFGFIELYIERIEAFTHIQNEKSKNLLVKNGFNIIEDRKDNDDKSNIVFEIRKSK